MLVYQRVYSPTNTSSNDVKQIPKVVMENHPLLTYPLHLTTNHTSAESSPAYRTVASFSFVGYGQPARGKWLLLCVRPNHRCPASFDLLTLLDPP